MNPKKLVLWILWFAIISGLCMVYVFLGRKSAVVADTGGEVLRFVPLIPLVISVAVRFLLLPRLKSLIKVLPIYVVGLAMAEGSGLMAIFLLSYADALNYFTTAVIVLLMYVPLFASKLEED